MKKLLFALLTVVVLLVAAVLVAPSLVDWNEYKREIALQTKALTGRDIRLGGDIKAAILPAPAFSVADVSLANLPGAAAREMVRLKQLEVQIALLPLLSGRVEIRTVRLVEPVIELEVLADGRKNWDLGATDAAKGAKSPSAPKPGGAPAAGGPATPFPVSLDSFKIESGTLVYRDARAGTVERIEAINARVAAPSLEGPFDSAGTLRARGMSLAFAINLGRAIGERTVPLNLTLGIGKAQAQIAGTITGLLDEPRFRGKVKLEGENAAELARALAAGGEMPGLLAQPFAFEGTLAASQTTAEIKGLDARFGDSRATGAVQMRFDKGLGIGLQLAVNVIDLDKWLAAPPSSGAAAAPGGRSGNVAAVPPAKTAKSKPPAVAATPAAPTFAIPTGIAANAQVSVDAITYRGGLIGQARLKAELAEGEITVSQLSAQLPGGSDVAMFGFVGSAGGRPRFEGQFEVSVADLRGVLKWLGVEPPPVPAERLRTLRLASKVVATPEQVQLAGLDMQFDSSRLTGGIAVALRQRPSFGVDLTLDRINIDSFLAADRAALAPAKPAASPAKGKAGGGAPAATPAQAQAPARDPLAGFAVLDAIDANIKAQVKAAVFRGTTVRDLALDATLFNGALTVRRLALGDFAGASASLSGSLSAFNAGARAKDLRFEARAPDLAKTLRAAGIEPTDTVRRLGAFQANGRIDGALLAPAVDMALKAAGADVSFAGKLALLPAPAADGAVKIRHADLAKLLVALGVDYRPSGRIGAIDVASNLKADPRAIALAGLKASAGEAKIEGTVQVALDGPRPKITADLTAGELRIDPFLPPKRTAALETPPSDAGAKIVPAAWRPSPGAIPPSIVPAQARRAPAPPKRGQWSADPIDLAALRGIDADAKLKAKSLIVDRYRLTNADLAAVLANGVLRADKVTGTLFGGALSGNLALDARAAPKIDAAFALKDADIGQAVVAFVGEQAASGRLALDAKLASSGGSVAALVGALGGSGSLALTGVETRGGAQGSALAGALGLVGGLAQIGGALGGGKQGASADITGTFSIERGLATSNDLKLASAIANGQAKGSVDLPGWSMDVAGELQLAPNLLTAALDRSGRSAQPIPFQLKGPLDAPNVRLDTSRMPGGLPIPGADKLLKKKGVGDVLKGVLGVPGGTQQAPSQAPPTPQQQQQQQPQQPAQKKIRPEDILKGLFR